MNYTANSFAAMLLCLALSPNKEEFARPLSTSEYRDICQRAHLCAAQSIGGLIGVDISGLMQMLNISEEQAYRLYILMNRSVQLSYAMEAFADKGIFIVTEYETEYPERLRKRAGNDAPPVFYLYGDPATLNLPSIGVLGVNGVKTAKEARSSLSVIAEFARKEGYRVMCGSEPGVSRVMEGFLSEGDGDLTCVPAGGMSDYLKRPEAQGLIAEDRLSVLSLVHPDALFTVPHALSRNRMLMSLAEAVFVFNTDGRRGETDALRNHRCDWIYAWNGYPGNHNLLNRGAVGFGLLTESAFKDMTRLWKDSRSEQISLFDLMPEE